MSDRAYHRTACPICRSRGKDESGDNLAVYADGHSYCYACGYFIPTKDTVESVKSKLAKPFIKTHESKCDNLPIDISSNLSLAGKAWLMGYGLNIEEQENFWWSESRQQLIFPIFNKDGLLVFWQARNFAKGRTTKYFTSGSLYEELLLFGDTGDSSKGILVEDTVSAIKIARDWLSIPLFGSTISDGSLIYLRDVLMKEGIHKVDIWLDADKKEEAIKISNRAKELGIDMGVITSAFDPKCYTDMEINKFITRRMNDTELN